MGGCVLWHISLRRYMTNGCLFFLKVPLCSFKVLKQWNKVPVVGQPSVAQYLLPICLCGHADFKS